MACLDLPGNSLGSRTLSEAHPATLDDLEYFIAATHLFPAGRWQARSHADLADARRGGSEPRRNLYTAAVEHEAAPTVTVMAEPAGVSKRRIVTDPELLVSSVQLCPPSDAVASVPGWFEVT